MNQLGSLIQRRKDELGETYQVIADRSGVLSRSTIHALVRKDAARRPPSTKTMDALAKGLRLPKDVIYAAAAADAGYRLVEVGDITVKLDRSRDMQIIAALAEDLTPEQFAQVRAVAEEKAAELIRNDQDEAAQDG